MTNKRILIIDDEADIREATKLCLEVAAGWEILTASSGIEGLQTAASEPLDAILLDVMMPDMDGLTTFEKLQANPKTQNIPVILLTAKAQPAEQRQFTQLAVTAVITKPYDPLTIASYIAEVLN
ncbi:MAG: response regulator [Leptolyngbyaceae cyanobacterium RM2_2_4]|nr:response regulator [Leptolyngbyaceae cyanobacterium SM1_4_3]NJN90443.1 response regulator [Leptolyngbyaceae cyanobacterium SL_5_14]NJO51909.1 response regulator [Leptolyngbyaceae cyanobacterium RM2_2_4]NJO66280.1 response regulator [Leptolyngbyaceae cyanobacterium RM1_405_57]